MEFTIVVLLASAGLILGGFVLMSRLDRLLESGQSAEPSKVDVAIFCSGAEAAPLTDRLSRQGVTFRLCPTPAPTEHTQFNCALALSDSDMDNLLFCREVRRCCGELRLMAKCNDRLYHDIFLENGVCALFPPKWTPESILHAMERARQ